MKMAQGLRADRAKKPRMEKFRCVIRMMHEEKGCAEELNRMTGVQEGLWCLNKVWQTEQRLAQVISPFPRTW